MKYYDKVERVLIMIGLASMGIVLLYQVFMRYVLNNPIIWSEEFARYVFVWFSYLGASYGVKRNAHIRLTFLHERLPKAAQGVVNIVTNLFMAGIFLYLVPFGFDAVAYQHKMLSSALQIPMSFVFVVVPIGLILISVRLLINTFKEIKLMAKGEEKKWEL